MSYDVPSALPRLQGSGWWPAATHSALPHCQLTSCTLVQEPYMKEVTNVSIDLQCKQELCTCT